MARRECNDLIAPADKKTACADDERTGPLPHKARKCHVDVTRGADIQHNKLQPKSTRGRLHLAHRDAASGTFRSTSRAMTAALGTSSCSSESCFGTKSTPNQLTPVMFSPGRLRLDDHPELDRITAAEEDDGNSRRRGLGRECRGVGVGNDHHDPAANQIGGERRQSIILALRPAVFDRHVPALDSAGFVQALAECSEPLRERPRRHPAEEPNHRHRRLLRARGERPPGRRAAEKRDELAPSHCLPRGSGQGIVPAQTSTRGSEVRPADVRFGSKADICGAKSHVRFTPESRHVQCNSVCPLCANSGHRQLYSITSSAVASNVVGTVRPRALAVLRLIVSWYFVGC